MMIVYCQKMIVSVKISTYTRSSLLDNFITNLTFLSRLSRQKENYSIVIHFPWSKKMRNIGGASVVFIFDTSEKVQKKN